MKVRKYIPAIVAMYILFFTIAFVTGLHNPLGVIVKFQYDVPMAIALMGNLMNFIAYAFMGFPAGLLLKRYGYKFTSLVAIITGIIGVGLLFLSGQIQDVLWLYFVGAFVSGLSMCMLNAVVNPMLNLIGGGGNRGNQLLQWGGSLNSLAATIVPFVIGFLMGRSMGSVAPGGDPAFTISLANPVFFALVAIFILAMLIVLFAKFPEQESLNAKEAMHELIVKDDHNCFSFRHFRLGLLAVFLYMGVEVSIANIANLYMIHELGMNPLTAGGIVAIYWFLMFVGRMIGGWLGSKFSSRYMLSFASTCAMIFILITIFTPAKIMTSLGRYDVGVPVNVLFLVCSGLFVSVMWGNIYNLSVEGLGKYTPTATGFFMMMVCGGGIIPVLQALVADSFGCRASFWIILICLAYLMYFGSEGYRNVNKKIKVD